MRSRLVRFLVVPVLALTGHLFGAGLAAQQQRTITGKVTESGSNSPLEGVNIGVRGTTIGTIARADGSFTLRAPDGPVTLLVRRIGYKKKDVPVAATNATVNVALERDILNLERVVVTGAATQVEQRNVATAVSTVTAEDLVRVSVPSVEQALQGKFAGAKISQNSGAPGGGMTIRMRGVTSIIGSFTPLYVVDGVIVSDASIPQGTNAISKAVGAGGIGGTAAGGATQDNPANRIADLNPDDIENVEILKGASAAAIYGSKASNGVILITTKRGKQGRPEIRFAQRQGASRASTHVGTRTFKSVEDATAAFGAQGTKDFAPGKFFNNEDALIGRTPKHNETAVTASGGGENTRYFASGLSRHEGGIIENTFADKQSLRINLDQTISDRVSVSLGSEVVHTAGDRGLTQNENNGSSYYSALSATPSFFDLRRRPDGSWPVNPYASSNPLQTADLFRNRESVWRVIGTSRLDAMLFSAGHQELRFLGIAGADVFTQKNSVFSPPELQFEPLDGLPGTSVLSFGQNSNLNVSANLVHRWTPSGSKFTATTQAGMQYEDKDQDISRTQAQNLIGGLQNVNNGTALLVEEARQRVRDVGIFAQEEVLTFGEKLLLTAGIRADRSTNNGDTQKLYIFPKASASYRQPINKGWFDEIKFRTAFGDAGNQPQFGQKFTELLSQNVGGLPAFNLQGATGAADIRPERQREIEGGVDFTLFKGRGRVGVTGYQKNISDLLLTRSLPPTSGFVTQLFNGGSLRDRGFELESQFVPVLTRDLTWTVNGNFSLDRCMITSLPVPGFRPTGFLNGAAFGSTFIQEGKSCTQITGNDLQPDGTIREVPLADANPKYVGSIGNDISYKQFRVYFLFDHRKGGVLDNITLFLYDILGNSADYDQPAEKGLLSGKQRVDEFVKGRFGSIYLQEVSYWKLRELTASYEIPHTWTRHVWDRAKDARVSLTGRNLLTWTPYRTGDPEANQVSRSAAAEVPWDIWAYPANRSVWLSLEFRF